MILIKTPLISSYNTPLIFDPNFQKFSMNSSNSNHYYPTAIETAVQNAWTSADVYRVNEQSD